MNYPGLGRPPSSVRARIEDAPTSGASGTTHHG